jgi:hypothetical protein
MASTVIPWASDLPTVHVRVDQCFGVAADGLAKARDSSQIELLWCAFGLLSEKVGDPM